MPDQKLSGKSGAPRKATSITLAAGQGQAASLEREVQRVIPEVPPGPRLLLITGAGASTALARDERPLPLMKDWAERLRAKVGAHLSQMTALDQAQDGVEFEETLGALLRWLEGLDGTLRFVQMVRQQEAPDNNPATFTQMVRFAQAHGNGFLQRLHESLFEEFGPQRIDADKAVTAYRDLFEVLGFGNPFPPFLICATTNYDRSMEIALGALGMTPRTGFTSHSFLTPVLDPRGLGTFTASSALLYLHGAVGWYRRDDGSIQAMPADQGFNPTLGRPAVLYPSPNKDPEISETAALWGEFRNAVDLASHILVLGHGLNDSHLVRELTSTRARIGVAYHATDDSAKVAAAERRIKDLLPGAFPVAARLGPEPSLDEKGVKQWRG